ncbi:MAG: hypothetical protein INR69_09250 [Mucilaginibacter polytrichastri]|nr:hypothetical protein [Mucilaginibacter polytrichastri]
MKSYYLYLGSLILALYLSVGTAHAARAQTDDVTFQDFYDELEPYGQWIDDPQYGYVWRPDVGNDFRPYGSNGYWTMTEYGNMWVSNYDWGWAPFHYGRWTLNARYGWLWIPGTEWGPAWVSWRQGGGYYGWAPLGPGINININFGRRYYAPDPWWCFVPQRHFLARNFYSYCAPFGRNVTIIRNTTIINNTYVRNNVRYVTGPRANDIQRVTRQRVNVYRVDRSARPGVTRITNNTVNVYRPQVNRVTNSVNRPAPSRVVRNGETVATNTDRQPSVNRGGNRPSVDRVDRSPSVTRPGNTPGRPERTARENAVRTPNTDNNVSERVRPTRPERVMERRASESAPQRAERMPSPQRQNTERQVQRQQPQRVERAERQVERPQRQMQNRPERAERGRRP